MDLQNGHVILPMFSVTVVAPIVTNSDHNISLEVILGLISGSRVTTSFKDDLHGPCSIVS